MSRVGTTSDDRSERIPHPAAGHAQLEAGRRFLASGDYRRAEQCYEAALNAGADPAEAHHGLGQVFLAEKRLEDACDSLEIAVHHGPEHAAAWIDLALALAQCGEAERAGQAAAQAERLIRSAPQWAALGQAYKRMGRLAEAGRCYGEAFALDSHCAEHACQLGYVRFLAGEYEQARAAYVQALEADPGFAPALHNLGLLQLETGFPAEALESFRQAFAKLKRPESAAGVAHALRDLGELEAACAAYDEVLRQNPDFGDARINAAYAVLMRGHLQAGWSQYETRFAATGTPAPDHGHARWAGEALNGRRLLVYGEQGIGDEIMFASCVPDLARLDGPSVLACDARLAPLFARSFPHVQVHGVAKSRGGASGNLPKCDFELPIGSLPLHFRRTADAFPGTAYLVADPARVRAWRPKLGEGPELKIGIAWRGGALRTRQWLRSTLLSQWRDVLALPGCRFYSLQHGGHQDELAQASREAAVPITDCSGSTQDMDQLAALVCALDMIVTVDNTLVHLAGALGRPTWVLLPSAPEWRYPRSGERMPWFASVRLFRPPVHGGAAAALPQLARALQSELPRLSTARASGFAAEKPESGAWS